MFFIIVYAPHCGNSSEYPQSIFEQKIRKIPLQAPHVLITRPVTRRNSSPELALVNQIKK